VARTAHQTQVDSEPPAGRIGVFDSGVGGLSVLREIVRILPHQELVYFADSAHVPYGDREIGEIRALSQAITAFLVEQAAVVVVVACNTASAAALYHLRARFDVPIVGMEPAIKPAAERTHSQQIGVLATPATFQGALYGRLVERFARETVVHTQVCPGLVERVEAGQVDHPETEALLRQYLAPLLSAGIDALVLGCTHYPFLRPVIERIVGAQVEVIDPASAVARQTGRVLDGQGGLRDQGVGRVTCFTSGDPVAFEAQVCRLVELSVTVRAVRWQAGTVKLV
jgi:glutamate racemase